MKYSVLNAAFGNNSAWRTIETEKDIKEAIFEAEQGLVKLKDGSFIGVDLLRNSLIKPVQEQGETSSSLLDMIH